MKKVLVFISLALLVGLISSFAFAETPAEVIVKADALYDKADMASVKESMKLYKSVMTGNEEAGWKFARSSYWVGVRTATKADKELIFDDAYKAVRPYYDSGSNNVPTNYWFALSAGKYGKIHGVLKSLFLVKPMKTAANKVVSKDPGYEDGSAYTILGAIEYEVPGGDKKKTIEYCNKKIGYEPNDISANLYLGKAYYDTKAYAKAKERLDILIANAKPETADEKADVAEAKELLVKVKAKM